MASAVRACSRWPTVAYSVPRPRVVVGLERAHAEIVGEGEGLAVMGGGWLALRGITPRGDLTEETQGTRFVAAFLVRTGERQRPLGEGVRRLQVASKHLRLP